MKKWILGAALSGSLFTGANAETTNEVTDAERIVVTATRSASDIKTIPGNPTVITAKDIADGHYISVPEALQKKAGLFFRNYADNPSQAMIDMRGFGDNSHGRVLVLVDGRRLNEADMSALNWSAIPLNSIERIEVLSGPSAALYGDNAIGGVINIITAKGSEKSSIALRASAGSYEAFDQNATVSGQIKGLGYTAAAGHQSGNGYRDRSRYDNTSIYTGLDFMPNEYTSGNAAFSVVDRQYQLPGALSATQVHDDRRQSDESSDVKDTQYNTQLGGKFTPDEVSSFALDLGYRHMDQFANMNREWGPFASYSDVYKDVWSVEPRYTLTLPVGQAVNETTVGTDLRNETIQIDRFTSEARNIQSADAKVEQETVDFYLNDRLFLLDDKLIVNAGGRSGQSRIKVKDTTGAVLLFDETKARQENAFTAGLTALPNKKTKLYTKYDEFYRFPFTDEQAIYTGSVWADSFTDLEPERGRNFEMGGTFSPTEKSELGLTAYRMEMQNELRFNPTTFGNENLPKTLHQGIEASGSYQPADMLRMGLKYFYTEAEFSEGANADKNIPWVPRNRFAANIDFMPLEGLTLSAIATYTGGMHAINDNGNNGSMQNGYTLIDLLASYKMTIRDFTWDIFAGIDNIFEKEYDMFQVSNAAGTTINHYPAPERTYKAGVGVKF